MRLLHGIIVESSDSTTTKATCCLIFAVACVVSVFEVWRHVDLLIFSGLILEEDQGCTNLVPKTNIMYMVQIEVYLFSIKTKWQLPWPQWYNAHQAWERQFGEAHTPWPVVGLRWSFSSNSAINTVTFPLQHRHEKEEKSSECIAWTYTLTCAQFSWGQAKRR